MSHPLRVANKLDVAVVMGSSRPTQRPAKPHEVILDQSDGLGWPTLFKCDLIHTVPKAELTNRRGRVTVERRWRIIETILRSHDWTGR
ncbi:MAG: type II toxin-antitoxin system PemK/MazF family toxin [Verrucomicrobia bacterium]|nr:type II toxin-antitoxin system PemK/MazF family toxin [Verrucomicrobiota bacterium]